MAIHESDMTEAVKSYVDALQRDRDDLVAALERTLSWITSYPGNGAMGKDGPYEQARAALAKAEGK